MLWAIFTHKSINMNANTNIQIFSLLNLLKNIYKIQIIILNIYGFYKIYHD